MLICDLVQQGRYESVHVLQPVTRIVPRRGIAP